jgi:membrane protease YdiL (CAAX protease family)
MSPRGFRRTRAFLRFIGAVAWAFVAYILAAKAAHGFGPGATTPLLRDLFAIFLLILGYSYMELIWDNARHPVRALGLPARPDTAREFGLGAALGWGMTVAVFLVIVIVGQYYVRIQNTSSAWTHLVLEIFTLAAGSLMAELVFRGYPFQKLVQAVGPLFATILAGLFFGLVSITISGTTVVAMWIYGVAAVLLSVAYLRTRALWLPWGLHFTWLAATALLFGQPIAGDRNASSVIQSFADGPTWLTGGEYGPASSVVTLVAMWIGLLLLLPLTRNLARKYSHPEPGLISETRYRGFSGDFESPAAPSRPANHRPPELLGSSAGSTATGPAAGSATTVAPPFDATEKAVPEPREPPVSADSKPPSTPEPEPPEAPGSQP